MAALRSLPADALLSRPTGLVVLPSGKLCVAGAHGLALLLESGKRSKQQPRKAPPLDFPTGLACSDSALFVACKGSHQVIKLDLHDNFALVASCRLLYGSCTLRRACRFISTSVPADVIDAASKPVAQPP